MTLRTNVGPGPNALVFVSPHGGPVRYTNFHRRFWRPATKAIGRPKIGLHVLRHTCASLLVAQGAPIKAIQAQLGHRSAELTLNRYGHLDPDQVEALAASLDAARAAVAREITGQEPGRAVPDGYARPLVTVVVHPIWHECGTTRPTPGQPNTD